MTGFVKISKGSYRNTPVVDEVFPLVRHYQVGAKGGFITVDGTGQFGKDKIRVLVADTDFEYVDGSEYTGIVHKAKEAPTPKSAAEIEIDNLARMSEISQRFDILDIMTKSVIAGEVRAMIVSGPPGVGKSFTVEKELERASLFDKVASRKVRSTIVTGSASAIGLYQTLYDYSEKDDVIVFDDCDSILFDEDCLNLLKGALDSGKPRKISWMKESNILDKAGIPNSFTFRGNVIFITNLKFDGVKNQRMQEHLGALTSRCHYLDLTLDTMRDKILRIRQIAETGVLFQDYNFEQCVQDEIIEFMNTNQNRMREMSLRMAIKIADLRRTFPMKWQMLAENTCMRHVN